jgi:HEAT repeat protein
MAASLHAFRVGILEEHLEEASFLYTQCRHMRLNAGKSWRLLENFEQRLELHLDALVIGGQLALDLCIVRAVEGDFGELFAAVCLYCRQNQAPLLAQVFNQLDTNDFDRTNAVADALKYELPLAWSPFVEQALNRQDDRLLPLLAVACGYRRMPCESALRLALERLPSPPMALIDALGRIRATSAADELKRVLSTSNPLLQSAALIALLRIGRIESLHAHYLVAQKESWPRITMGIAGDVSAAHALAQPLSSGQVDENSIFALGLLGVPSTLRDLHEYLEDPVLAPCAARAMNWICGADLFEDAFVAAPISEDELFPREIKAWRQYREVPLAADGKPFGLTERKLSVDSAVWHNWFASNISKFERQLRYRSGKPYAPIVLFENMAHPQGDGLLRKYAAEELAIRYGCDIPFETDMPVTQQVRALRAIRRWVREQDGTFQPGGWVVNGRSE